MTDNLNFDSLSSQINPNNNQPTQLSQSNTDQMQPSSNNNSYNNLPPSNIKKIVIIISFFVLIILGFVLYGFWYGSRVVFYSGKVNEIIIASDDWLSGLDNKEIYDDAVNFDENKLYSLTKDLEDQKEVYDKIKTKAEANLYVLSNLTSSKKTQQLSNDIKEYLELGKKLSEEGIYSIDLFNSALDFFRDALNESRKLNNEDLSALNEEQGLVALKNPVKRWQEALERLKVPQSMKETQDKVLKTVKELSLAIEDGNQEALSSINNPFVSIDSSAMQSDYEKSYQRIGELLEIIKKDSEKLKKSNFVLF